MKQICKLTGKDGNAFAVISRVTKSLIQAGVEKETIRKYTAEATAGDYNHLLATSIQYLEAQGIEVG